MARVFVTGASGFAGRATIRELEQRGHDITALSRHTPLPGNSQRWQQGDLLDVSSYRGALGGSDVVVHLAAATGRASAREQFRTNVEGTGALIGACRATGVPKLLFVSSVAVQFPDHTRYPYAQAKAAAETLVQASSLAHLIVRPTIIAGPGSPVIGALAKLARAPVVPVFGDGTTRVQPIDVDDVARALADLVERGGYDGGTVGLGGPAVVTIEQLLVALRRATGRGGSPVVHIPLGPVLAALAAAESVVPANRLPLSYGQLGTFRFDGTVAGSPLIDARRAAMQPLAAMLERSLS